MKSAPPEISSILVSSPILVERDSLAFAGINYRQRLVGQDPFENAARAIDRLLDEVANPTMWGRASTGNRQLSRRCNR